jgi:hypothetical protein
MEFGMHGVSHEHFRGGVEQRAEYAHINESHPGHAETWGWRDMTLKARCFRDILHQWFTKAQLAFPVAEVPPAHAYYYRRTDPQTTGALLAKYGVKYVNGGMNYSTRIYEGYLIDHGVIFINRAYGTNWDWVGSTPWEGYWNDYDAPYYPSDNYAWNEAHFPNLWDAKDKWVGYLVGLNDSNNRFLARNSAEASWQFLYHKFGTITGSDGDYTIDVSQTDPQVRPARPHGPQGLRRRRRPPERLALERRERLRVLEGHVRVRLRRDRPGREPHGSARPGHVRDDRVVRRPTAELRGPDRLHLQRDGLRYRRGQRQAHA